MRRFIAIAKALSDPARVRALLSLRDGQLCLCQIIDLLGLAPSTVSKHMDLLYRAGLIQRRKEGRWHYFRLVGRNGEPAAQRALRWVLETLKDQPVLKADARKLRCIRKKDLKALSACYRETRGGVH